MWHSISKHNNFSSTIVSSLETIVFQCYCQEAIAYLTEFVRKILEMFQIEDLTP